ncbi:hypothetical protein FB451DRAFT_1183091 [Mycena latifolia]|nr:hypothetical protein FB451DRAFT_1183091 [Mycena latifolia]
MPPRGASDLLLLTALYQACLLLPVAAAQAPRQVSHQNGPDVRCVQDKIRTATHVKVGTDIIVLRGRSTMPAIRTPGMSPRELCVPWRLQRLSNSSGDATATYLHPKYLVSALQVDTAPRQGPTAGTATAAAHRRWRGEEVVVVRKKGE